MNKKTKIGVVGVGHLGQHHTKHYSNIVGANLVGVFDLNQERGKAVAAKHAIKAYKSLSDLLSNVEAVSVVTPTEEHKNVFKPFFRLDKSRSLNTAGIGLGLSISEDIVNSHGGSIQLSESKYSGLMVRISLPL